MSFKIGDVVVCKGNGGIWKRSQEVAKFQPKRGQDFTIRGIEAHPNGVVGLFFEGVPNESFAAGKFEKKVNPLSMTFTAKTDENFKKQREELILVN